MKKGLGVSLRPDPVGTHRARVRFKDMANHVRVEYGWGLDNSIHQPHNPTLNPSDS